MEKLAMPQTGLQVKALHDNVVIREIIRETTSGGIYLPTNDSSQMLEGEVVAVGPGLQLDNGLTTVSVQVGDMVMMPKSLAMKAKINGDDYYIAGERDILLVL
jgi:co-chaperonin GroES (HSP10)